MTSVRGGALLEWQGIDWYSVGRTWGYEEEQEDDE
jgi:hypothetical protein